MADTDIAVVGMACVFPKAPDLHRFRSNLVNAVDAIDEAPPDRWEDRANFRLPPAHEAHLPGRRGGFIPDSFRFDPTAYGVLPNLVLHGDPDQFLALHVIAGALRDAGVAADAPVRERTDVIVGRGGYPTAKLVEMNLRMEVFEATLEMLQRRFPDVVGPRRAEMEAYLRSTLTPRELDNTSTAIASLSASRAANRLNLRGTAYTVDGACASSLLAVEHAVWRLRNGQCDLAVAGGLFMSLAPTMLYVFSHAGALSPTQALRPFDRRADGIVGGEGAGAVALKRLADAVRDGDPVYAVIKGVGFASDGRALDVMAPSSPGQVKALERAYADARIDPATVGLLEAHGTGTVAGDLAELATIKAFYGPPRAPGARAMGSVKSMIGHTMPAAGIAALIKAAVALTDKVLPPSLHCDEPRPELADCPFYVNTQTRPWVHAPGGAPRRAGVNAFGFGGINAHVVLEEAVPAPAGAWANGWRPDEAVGGALRPRPVEALVRRETELAVFTADSADDLAARLRRLESFLDHDGTAAELPEVARALAREADPRRPVKLALVCRDLDHLRGLLRQRIERPDAPGDGEAVFFSAGAACPGKVAFVFPGMGFPGLIGNYPDHLLQLCLHYPEVRAEFDAFEERDRHPDDRVPTSVIFSPPPCLPEELRSQLKARLAPPRADDYPDRPVAPHERYLAAMGVTLGNWAGWVLLRKFGIPADMITGQSQGEMAALCAAGAGDFRSAAPAFWKILNVDTRDRAGGRLAFAWAAAETVEPFLADHPGTYLAIHMAPTAVIFGGDRDGVERVAERLRERQHLVQVLPYPPIHTPTLRHLRADMLRELEGQPIEARPPRVDLYSSITASKYPTDPDAIRETLLLNLDHPLQVWQTIRRMYDDGARVFVQVGGGHLAAHLKMLLPDGAEALTAALDSDTVDPLTQLHRLAATLFCAGVPLSLDPLFEHRPLRDLDLGAPRPAAAPARMALPLRIDWTPVKSPHVPPLPAPSPTDAAARDLVAGLKGRLPVLGDVTRYVPDRELTIERTLDLAEDRYLCDHLFVNAPCKPDAECLPVVPLSMSLEFAAEAGALLAPARGLIGFEAVRGRRWIGLREGHPVPLHIEASVQSDDAETGVRRVRVAIHFEGSPAFTATALFASDYRRDVTHELAAADGSAWPISIDHVYRGRWLFHGPAFQCVTSLGTFGNPAATAEMTILPADGLFGSTAEPLLLTDPCIFDGVGQVFGLWAAVHGHYVFPVGIDKVELYRPTPPPGTRVPIHVEVTGYDAEARQIRCDVELGDGSGGVWARVVGWKDFVFRWPDRYAAFVRFPVQEVLAEPVELPGLPPGAVTALVKREHFGQVDLEWAGRLFLHSREMPAYREAASKERKRQLVMGRAAAKDAARLWRQRQGNADGLHPAELSLEHDSHGRPAFAPSDHLLPAFVSVAHTEGAAIALAADMPVGIDLEPADRDTRPILPEFATAAEAALVENLEAGCPGENWATLLWCAKEAAAKALGTGFEGRPKSFQAIDADGEAFLIHHDPTGERWLVSTARLGDWIVAHTSAAEPCPPADAPERADQPATPVL